MSIPFVLLLILCMLLCVATIAMILMQKKRTAGISGAVAGMGQAQTYWDKNKGRSREGMLEKYTKITGACFMVISLLLNIIS